MRIALIVPGVGGVQRAGHERVISVTQALIERLARRHEVFVVAWMKIEDVKEHDGGYWVILIILLCCFVVPGILYAIWGGRTTYAEAVTRAAR